MSDTLVIISIYLIFLLGTLVFKSRIISGPWLFLFRSFLPNWRFYHRVGPLPQIYVRYCASQIWNEWQLIQPRAVRRYVDLFHNPDNNLALAMQNLVEHLAADLRQIDNPEHIRTLVTYRLVLRFARLAAQKRCPDSTIQQYQFQLRMAPPFGVATLDAVVLESAPVDY